MYDYMNGTPGDHMVSRVKLGHHTARSSVPTGRQGYGGDPFLSRAGNGRALEGRVPGDGGAGLQPPPLPGRTGTRLWAAGHGE